MKSTVAAAIAIILAMAATTACAGVVVSQDLVSGASSTTKSQQTVLIQGHKQKVVRADRIIITDLDAGTVNLIFPKSKQIFPVPFPPRGLLASGTALFRLTVPFKKTGATHKVAGYECQEYAGDTVAGSLMLHATECMSTDAPGAKEFTEFEKTMAEKLKGKMRVASGEHPEGIPLTETTARTAFPFKPSPGLSPEVAAKIQAKLAENKAIVEDTTVSKIEVKDLAANTFEVPADYNKGHVSYPHIETHGGKVVAPGSVPAGQGVSPKPGASAPAAAPAAAASH